MKNRSTNSWAGGRGALAKSLLLALTSLCALNWLAPRASASEHYWTGASSANWSDPHNWTAALPLPVVIGTNNAATKAVGGTRGFYRLSNP